MCWEFFKNNSAKLLAQYEVHNLSKQIIQILEKKNNYMTWNCMHTMMAYYLMFFFFLIFNKPANH